MVSINKPNGITVIVLDRKSKKSKSLTVYGGINEVYAVVKKAFKSKK